MSDIENDFLAFVKYEGLAVENGYLDARKSAEALMGIDEIIRYFLYQEDFNLQTLQFEIPVRIRKGSWEALIPQTIEQWIKAAIAIGLTTYGTTALKKLAENDFKDKNFKDVFKIVFKGIKWVLRIGSHLGTMTDKRAENIKFKEDNNTLEIINTKGDSLIVPRKFYEIYVNCPDKLFSKLTKVIEVDRDLIIGINKDEATDADDFYDVKITIIEKYIFTQDAEDIILFPELKHGDYTELGGHVSRGNENANTIGFEYSGHILTCYPTDGNIIKYKNLLFTNCLIKGFVDRTDEEGNFNEKRPRIRFVDLIQIPKGGRNLTLFPSN